VKICIGIGECTDTYHQHNTELRRNIGEVKGKDFTVLN
jgi:hypothetical protein